MDEIVITVPRDELLALLAKPTHFSGATLEKARKKLEEYDAGRVQSRLEAMEEADVALPLLLEAERLGTYVSTYGGRLGGGDQVVVVAPDRVYIGLSSRVLEVRGYPIQTVGKSYGSGTSSSWRVLGERLRPPGDERSTINEDEVYLEGGRCGHCGRTKDQALGSACLLDRAHTFHSVGRVTAAA